MRRVGVRLAPGLSLGLTGNRAIDTCRSGAGATAVRRRDCELAKRRLGPTDFAGNAFVANGVGERLPSGNADPGSMVRLWGQFEKQYWFQ